MAKDDEPGKESPRKDSTQPPTQQSGEYFHCRDCGAAVVWFSEVWMCMACHKKRSERQAQKDRALLKDLQIEKVKEHDENKPF
jgi:hypothetical protein